MIKGIVKEQIEKMVEYRQARLVLKQMLMESKLDINMDNIELSLLGNINITSQLKKLSKSEDSNIIEKLKSLQKSCAMLSPYNDDNNAEVGTIHKRE